MLASREMRRRNLGGPLLAVNSQGVLLCTGVNGGRCLALGGLLELQLAIEPRLKCPPDLTVKHGKDHKTMLMPSSSIHLIKGA